MAASPDLEKKVLELESKVRMLEFSAITTLLMVFLLFIFSQLLR